MPDAPRFYADEHIGKKAVRVLRSYGIDIVACYEVGMRHASDEHHLDFARRERRIMVTHDRDFSALHRAGYPHAGILMATVRRDVGRVVEAVRIVHAVVSPEEMIGRIEYF